MSIVATYDKIIKDVYQHIWLNSANSIDAKAIVADLDKIRPPEDRTDSRAQIYRNANGDLVGHDGIYDYVNKGQPNVRVSLSYFNDVLVFAYFSPGGRNAGRMYFKSTKWGQVIGLAPSDHNEVIARMVKGVLIGRFTLKKTGDTVNLSFII